MSFLVFLVVVFCRRMAPCFHRHVRLSSSQQCSSCAPLLPLQGTQVAKQMKKLNIKALNPSDIWLSGAGDRRGGAWMSCAAALNVVPPGHRAACASAFAEAATAAGLQGVDAAADGAPLAIVDAVTADNAADEPPEQSVAPPAVPAGPAPVQRRVPSDHQTFKTLKTYPTMMQRDFVPRRPHVHVHCACLCFSKRTH